MKILIKEDEDFENAAGERDIAAKLFGIDMMKKDLEQTAAPLSPIIFCHSKDKGFTGDTVNARMNAKICNDFFPTPTDVGICLTKVRIMYK